MTRTRHPLQQIRARKKSETRPYAPCIRLMTKPIQNSNVRFTTCAQPRSCHDPGHALTNRSRPVAVKKKNRNEKLGHGREE
ncbi:hypothetical protein RSAG8_02314, partial [Rhizoctonia solani AG-8 WAC10335]